MTDSRIAWFLGVFLLSLPLLLAAFKGEGRITRHVLARSLGTAAAIGVANALLWGHA
ncbi:hypothetical protein [Streptomyces sp. YIM 130001]|uniref:hypothetical protein n=1 Tax=Streptomyces sp. YIM 130001 TaxID=2259644 RepID=UPI0013C401CB|nr:hypothetical protein [Streptomyces sp. YIM 130001]